MSVHSTSQSFLMMVTKFSSINSLRKFSTSLNLYGKRNFRKFNLYEKRGSQLFWRHHRWNLDPELEILYNRGTRPVGMKDESGKLQVIPEMIPDIIVPDLEGFALKPYVSYRVPEITNSEFTPQDLFYAVYSKKIASDFEANKLNEDGTSIEPSEEEKLTAEEAKMKALMTGSDIYG